MLEMSENASNPPVRVAVSPLNGAVAPVENQFKKGHGPQGNRDTAGAIIKNYINGFARRNVRRATLERIANNDQEPEFKRTAANRILKAFDEGADFDRIVEHTAGRPKQDHDVRAEIILRTPADRGVEAATASERLRAILNPSGN
jgi:hypothetical protein